MSNKVTYTPGPWNAMAEECDKPYIRVRGTALGGRYKIANVVTPTYEGAHQREADETRCNAQLIAAAPELLNALRSLLRHAERMQEVMSKECGDDGPMSMSRDALTRAVGAA